MKMFTIFPAFFLFASSFFSPEISQQQAQQPARFKMPFDEQIVNAHQQINNTSCIPSSVEMVLKLKGKVAVDYYGQQAKWGLKLDGSFSNFDKQTIEGITFEHKFKEPRGKDFPLDELFNTIDKELSEKKFVIVSLAAGPGWHIYVIYDKLDNGDYAAFSKTFGFGDILLAVDVKERIKKMKGTDIMVYKETKKSF